MLFRSVCFDERIIGEYREVLLRPRFSFDANAIDALIGQIQVDGVPVVCDPLPANLPNPDDDMFIEAALAGNAVCLITGNLRHFPPESCLGVMVLTPRQFLDNFDQLADL